VYELKDGKNYFCVPASHDAGDVEQVCRRAIVINHGEIILDAPVATLKRDYLKTKTVNLLLGEPVQFLLKTDHVTGMQQLSIQAIGSIHEELLDTTGVSIVKAKGYELRLEIDTARSPLEPIIAAIMQQCHIQDMTIIDPPMKEIIAAIYNEKGNVTLNHGARIDKQEKSAPLGRGE